MSAVGAFVLGYCFRRPPSVLLAAGLCAGPLAVAGSTTSRGDGDGLWTLIFPIIIVLGFPAMLICAALGRALAERSGAVPLRPRWRQISPMITLVSILLAAAITWTEWPRGPWASLGRVVDGLAMPAGVVETERSHCDYLMTTCDRKLAVLFEPRGDRGVTCAEARSVLASLPQREMSGECAWSAIVRGGPSGRTTIEVRAIGMPYYYEPGPTTYKEMYVVVMPVE